MRIRDQAAHCTLKTARFNKKLDRGFPKIRGTFFGVPIMGIIVFWGLYWGPPIT